MQQQIQSFSDISDLSPEMVELFSKLMKVEEYDGKFYPHFTSDEDVWLYSPTDENQQITVTNQFDEKVIWKSIYNKRIENLLDNQGPGTTDMMVPFMTTIDDIVYVWTGDGISGDSLIIAKKPVTRSQLTTLIIQIHLDEEDEDGDEEV